MRLFVLICALLISDLCYVRGQSSCKTPSGGDGNCITLNECTALSIASKRKTSADITLLRNSHCGFQGNMPMVCCPDNSCITPEGRRGTCIDILSCAHLLNMLKPPSRDTIAYVQKSRCNGTTHNSVCCGAQMTQTQPVTRGFCTMTVTPPDHESGCCGIDSDAGDKIIGGTATKVGNYPWLALLEYFVDDELQLLCGGSLISSKYVITAAHCVKGGRGTPKSVRLGEYDTSNDGADCTDSSGGGQDCTEGITVIPIEKIITNNYNRKDLRRNDIALLRLEKAVPYTDFIRPICLPTSNLAANPPPNLRLYAAGWGAVNNTGVRSNLKLHVEVPFVPLQECQQQYSVPGENKYLSETQLCAGGEVNKDTCQGDSGGPLMYKKDAHYVAIGIVSFGLRTCGFENVPTVYTNVYEYNQWIRDEIAKDQQTGK